MKGQVSSNLDPTTITHQYEMHDTYTKRRRVSRNTQSNRHTNLPLTFLLLFLFHSLQIPQHFFFIETPLSLCLLHLTKNTRRARERRNPQWPLPSPPRRLLFSSSSSPSPPSPFTAHLTTTRRLRLRL